MTVNPHANRNMIIVAINVGILIGYTIYTRMTSSDDESIIGLAFLIAGHFVLCMFLAIFPNYTKAFLLSALAVVLIGFSTCFMAYSIH